MRRRPCLDCGRVGPWGRSGRCDTHRRKRARELDRSPARRRAADKYDHAHRARRRMFAPVVAAGGVECRRCGRPIGPSDRWHLGHDDDGGPSSPEHAVCNLAASNNSRRQTA